MKARSIVSTITLLAITLSCSHNGDLPKIQNAFKQWQQLQIEGNEFVSAGNCNYDFVTSHEEYSLVLGFPDEMEFDYADLNEDQKVDALVTFIPEQCDGGNLTAWMQYQILVLSNDSGYHVLDDFFEKVKIDTESGFYHLDSLDHQTFYGTYYDFNDDDGYCCPSIQKPLIIDFNTQKVVIKEVH